MLHFICRHLMTIFAIRVISVTIKQHAREILKYMWTHKGVQYLCAHYGYTSSTKNNFNRHMQSMHKEEYDKAKLEKDPKVNDGIHEKV